MSSPSASREPIATDHPGYKIVEAIRQAVAIEKWNATRLGYEAGVSEGAARAWIFGRSIPSGDRLELLRAKMPALRRILDEQSAPIREESLRAA
jgi:hypothetical protein